MSNGMPRFSIIITVYNRSELLRQAIDSACAQTFADREIIVVDDASTDDTPDVIRGYGDKIQVVTHATNQGCEVAYISGAAAARGDYFVFLDSDDLMFPWALDTYEFVLGCCEQPALLVSRLAVFSNVAPVPSPEEPGDSVAVVVFKDYLSRDRNIQSSLSMVVVRRDVYAQSGGFRHSTALTFNGSDHDFLLRVGCHGPAVLLERPRTVAYRVHQSNSVRSLRRVVEGITRLIVAERRGSYPGGWKRLLDRRAVIGNQTYWWSRCALLDRKPWLATRLLFIGFDMVLLRLIKRLQISIRGLIPTTKLQRGQPAQPIHPSP